MRERSEHVDWVKQRALAELAAGGPEHPVPERIQRYWHGGVPGLKPGDLIKPQPAESGQHLVDGCPTCEARKAGSPLAVDDNNPDWVYVTTDREYARLYAHGYPRGALYQVKPIGEMHDRTGHDLEPSWGVESARVLVVYDAAVTLSPSKWRRWQRLASIHGGGRG